VGLVVSGTSSEWDCSETCAKYTPDIQQGEYSCVCFYLPIRIRIVFLPNNLENKDEIDKPIPPNDICKSKQLFNLLN